jgi:hypothetical protein
MGGKATLRTCSFIRWSRLGTFDRIFASLAGTWADPSARNYTLKHTQ